MLRIPTERHTLDNGLRIVLSEDTTTPVVAVNLWYGVGSRNEPEGLTGFAHLFEHMMFQGSENVPKNRHFELVEAAGGSLNASTWFDRTNYFETVPAHFLERALWLESDRMGWMLPAMTQEKLDNQRDVVKNERRWRYDNQPYGDWDERLQALVFPRTHPYHHSVIGSMADIDAASLENVADFFRTFYIPNNAVLTVCGDFERDRALEMIERNFGEIPRGAEIPPLPGEVELDDRIGATVYEEVASDVPLPRVYVGCRVPSYLDGSFPTVEVARQVLGAGRASRLYRSLVREQRIAKDVVSYAFPLTSGCSMLLFWATGLPGTSPETLQQALFREFERMDSVAVAEVERGIALAETEMLEELERVGERADALCMFEQFFGDPARINGELERLRDVDPTAVANFAGEYLGADNRAVLTYLPGGEG